MNPRKLKDHIEKLNAFVEVSRAKSFHRAARNLNVSQPSLSQAVRILEEILETRLLVRSQKGVELTQSGQTLLHFSERLISEVGGIESRLRTPSHPMAGTVTFGTYASLMSYLLPKFLVQISRKYPQLTLGVVTLKSEELSAMLVSRRCHFVIGTVPFKQKSITQFELYSDYFGFFCSKVKKSSSKNSDFKNMPLIYVAQAKDGEGRTLEETLNDAGHQHLYQYDIDNFESVRSLVCEGLGIGILPVRLAKAFVESGQLVEVSMPVLGKRFGAHQFYGSLLTQVLDDKRTTKIIDELTKWCKNV